MPFSPQFPLEFGIGVEVILDGALRASRYEHEVGDAGSDGLFDGILDEGLVDNWEKLLRHGLGGGQESRPETRYGGKTAFRTLVMLCPRSKNQG